MEESARPFTVQDDQQIGGENGQREPKTQIWQQVRKWADLLDVYNCKHLYYLANGEPPYIERTKAELKGDLRSNGIDSKWNDDFFWVVDHERAVDYAGPLSGRRIGIHHFESKKLLCTQGPTLIEARAGSAELIYSILRSLFRAEQLPYVLGWLSVARAAVISGSLRPGQVLIMAGAVNTGKSFTQKHIFTPMLGGRGARPFLFMSGKTVFNAELFGAEHWIFDDEAAADDPHMRKQIAAFIRQMASSDDGHCHDKGLRGATMPLFGRLSISCNDDEEGLLALPPLNAGLLTKVILCKAYAGDFAWPTTDAERQGLASRVADQMPAFAYELDRYQIPAVLADQRYGIKAYQDTEIAGKLERIGQDYELLQLARQSVGRLPQEKLSREWYKEIWDQEDLRDGLRRIVASHVGLARVFRRLIANRTPGIYDRILEGERLFTVEEEKPSVD